MRHDFLRLANRATTQVSPWDTGAMASSILRRSVIRRPIVSSSRVILRDSSLIDRSGPRLNFRVSAQRFASASATNLSGVGVERTHQDHTAPAARIAQNERNPPHKGHGHLSLFEMDALQIRDLKTAKEVEALVAQLEQLPTLTAADIGPLVVPLSRKASLLHDTSPYAAALLTERILFACLKHLPSSLNARNETSPYPHASLYNRTIIAWGNTKTLEGAERADRILQLMIAEYNNDPEHSPVPDRKCYKSTLRAWAVAKAPGAKHTVGHATERAFELLQEMEDLSGISELLQRDGQQFPIRHRHAVRIDPPDRLVYNSVMSSYAKAFIGSESQSLERIKSIVARMDELYAVTRNDEYKLDGHSYHSILRAYSRYVAYVPTLAAGSYVDEIVAVIQRLEKEGSMDELSLLVDRAWIYGVVVEALVKSDPRAVHIPKAHDYVLALTGRATADMSDIHIPSDSVIWPRHATLMKLIRAWQFLRHKDEKRKINELIDIAIDATYDRSFHLNEAMEEWIDSKFEFAPRVVELILAKALDRRFRATAKPTGQSFLIAMKAWLRSASDDAPYHAEIIFQNMLELYLESNDRYYKPREQHLRLLITAWLGRCGTRRRYKGIAGNKYPAEHIEALLQCHRGSDWFDKNVSGLYAMALRAWAIQTVGDGSDEPDIIAQLELLLDQLRTIQETEKLPAYPCNWVLEGCGRQFDSVDDRQAAYKLAVSTFRQSKHNARTFVLVTQAIKKQVRVMDESHVDLIEDLFQECCTAGMLTQDMILELVEVASAEALQKLLGVSHQYASGIVQVRDGRLGSAGGGLRWTGAFPNALRCENLPSAWRCNASRDVRVR